MAFITGDLLNYLPEKSHGGAAEPREILHVIPGIAFREKSASDTCWGSGGSYVLSHYRNAQTEADTVFVGCPACMRRWLDTLHREGGRQEVVHFVSQLAEAYRREGWQRRFRVRAEGMESLDFSSIYRLFKR